MTTTAILDSTNHNLPTAEAVSRQTIYALLDNTTPTHTQALVRKSGLNRLSELSMLAAYFCANDSFSEFHHMIRETTSFLEIESEAQLGRRLSSPIFRGWMHHLGRAIINGSPCSWVKSLLELWPNMLYDPLSSHHDFSAVFKVIDGLCIFFDPRFALVIPQGEDIRLIKNGQHLRVIQLTDDRSLATSISRCF